MLVVIRKNKMNNKAYHIILLLSLLICQKGKACFCISEDIETADYPSYEEIFLGKVLKIERIEVTEIYEKEEYELVGTITTFEVIKKWKGNERKIIKIYQQQSSCGIDFSITNSRWIIAAYTKSFVTDAFRREYPNKYLQTDNCSLYIEETDFEEFEKDIKRLDAKFPVQIELHGSFNSWKWIAIMFFVIGGGILIVMKIRKRTANNG